MYTFMLPSRALVAYLKTKWHHRKDRRHAEN